MNTNAPFGFAYRGLTDGSVPNFGTVRGYCAYNASAIYQGDPVVLSSGLIAVASTTGGTGAAVAGIAVSFSWVSIAQKRRVWQNYYPGSDSQGNANVEVLYVNNPGALFEAQSNGTAIAQADVGKGVNFATGSGSTYSGISGFSLDQSTLNATLGSLPFYVYGIEAAPRTDPTSSYNRVIVGFNNPTLAGGD